MNGVSFFGVKVTRSKTLPPKYTFAIQTVLSDWYVETGRVVEIPTEITVTLRNPLRKNMTDLSVRVLGMREDYHQKILKVESTHEGDARKDQYGNIYHVFTIPLLRKRSNIILKIKYTIATHPYSMNRGVFVDIGSVKKCFLKLQPYQKHTSQKIREIADLLASQDIIGTIGNVVLWVLKNIKYEKTYRRYSVTDTLSRRKGSCLSVADLLVAILRSLGIPATVVRGLYMDRLHAWVEGSAVCGHLWTNMYKHSTSSDY